MWITGWREPISMSGLGKVVGGILRRRPCFLCALIRGRSRADNPPRAVIIGELLSDAAAVTMRFGDLLDLPEHPDKGNAEADDDAQKHQRQAGGCEHGEHPQNDASGVPINVNKNGGLGAEYTEAAPIFPGDATFNDN
jgi:hypothetical protein